MSKKKRKNLKKIKKFAINIKVAPQLLKDIEALNMLCDNLRERLLEDIQERGYKAIGKPMLVPHADVDTEADKEDYKMEVKAIYVGKKKALEGENQ